MPRHNGNSGKKKKSRRFGTFDRQQEHDDPEPSKEEILSQSSTIDHTRRPSAGSVTFTRKIERELNFQEELTRKGLKKAFNGAGLWRDNPAIMQRFMELKQRAAQNLILRQQQGLENY